MAAYPDMAARCTHLQAVILAGWPALGNFLLKQSIIAENSQCTCCPSGWEMAHFSDWKARERISELFSRWRALVALPGCCSAGGGAVKGVRLVRHQPSRAHPDDPARARCESHPVGCCGTQGRACARGVQVVVGLHGLSPM